MCRQILRSEELSKNKEIFFTSTPSRIIHETALACPESEALGDNGKYYTYAQVEQYSNLIAEKLIREGVGREEIVCVYTGRNACAVFALLGIWKAGGAYLYIDNTYPVQRQDWIKRKCDVKRTLTLDWVAETIRDGGNREVPYQDLSRPEDMAVIIFTSGTTSAPKGVVVEHRNIAASISNFDRQKITSESRVSAFAGFGFIAAIFDTASTLAAGAYMDIIPEDTRRKIDRIVEYWNRERITHSFLPPHMALKLMDVEDSRVPLKLLLVSSEPVRNMRKKPYTILNVYASTETCSQCTVYEITDTRHEYPIGTVGPNTRSYVVGEDGQPVKQGEVGELWIAGPQITRGYWKLPEETAASYIKNPFTDDPKYAHLFKTKDRVKELPDGNLFFVGRMGHMYKIRGFRVEGGEVESAMLACENIKEVVVKAFEDKGGTNILCAFILADEKLDPKKIKEKLRDYLPGYMIPTAILQLDEMPHNPNGKADRLALQPPPELDDHKLLAKLY